MLHHQISLTSSTGIVENIPLDPSLGEYAVKICEVLAAIEASPDAPAGALLAAQAPIGLAALWLPDKPGYRKWMQKQLAKTERMG